LTERYGPADLRQDRRLFRPAGLKQVSNPWQTTGDVARLRTRLGNTRNCVTQLDACAVSQCDQRVCRQEENSCATTGQLNFVTCFINHLYRWPEILTGYRTILVIDVLHGGQAGQLDSLGTHGNTLLHIDEPGGTLGFCNDWMRVRIP